VAVKCPKCRKENQETAKFCSKCAEPLSITREKAIRGRKSELPESGRRPQVTEILQTPKPGPPTSSGEASSRPGRASSLRPVYRNSAQAKARRRPHSEAEEPRGIEREHRERDRRLSGFGRHTGNGGAIWRSEQGLRELQDW